MIQIRKTDFDNLLLIYHKISKDKRGFFKEIFRVEDFENFTGQQIRFCQENRVQSKKHVFRGLHFQSGKFAQSKLITVERGNILDIAVDIRKKSKTYGRCFLFELSSEDNISIFIPKGFAHGYLTLSDIAVVGYKVDNYYNRDSEKGININDKRINLLNDKNFKNFTISEKDKNIEDFKW